jgi:hypothetical protein
MATTVLTGKKFTVTLDDMDGSAQVTTGTVDETSSSNTIQTLAGSASISQGIESTISADFLYDGDQAAGGFYAVLKTALDLAEPVTVEIVGGTDSGATWTGNAVVTSLSAEFPADDAATCSAELTVSGALVFTPAVAAP